MHVWKIWKYAINVVSLCCICCIAVAFAAFPAKALSGEEQAEEDAPQRITVTASRIPTPIQNVAEPITVFTASRPGDNADSALSGAEAGRTGGGSYSAADIEARQYRSVLDVMQQTPGIAVNTSGGEGSVTGLYMRGMDTGNTRVILDGMPLNDPSAPDGSFDFGAGTLDNLGQLEILRGSQSTLYGSAATGGVVNMTSLKGEGAATGFASVEAGSRGTLRTRFGLSAGTDKLDYSFAGTLHRTDGISRADRRNGNPERDAYEYGSFNLRLGANATECLRLDLFANGFKNESEYDLGVVPAVDDVLKTKSGRAMIRPQLTLTLFDGLWEQKAGFGYMKIRRRFIDDNDPGDDWNRVQYDGTVKRFDYQSILRINESNAFLAGADIEEESMEETTPWYGSGARTLHRPDSVRTTSAYVEDQLNLRDVFFASAGLRYADHETFGNRTTWQTSAMLVLPTRTRLKASAGTGYKAPTLYQLYSSYGSRDLKAQRTLGWDAGFEQSFFRDDDGDDRLTLGSSFFRNTVKDGIDMDANTWKYSNIGDYKTWGVESFLNLRLTESIRFSAQHAWLRTEKNDTGKELGRRPKNTVTANIDIDVNERGTVTFGVVHVGSRWDDAAHTRKMPSYTTARVAASWKMTDRWEVFGRVENLLNKKYQQTYGYGTEGISFFGGLTASF